MLWIVVAWAAVGVVALTVDLVHLPSTGAFSAAGPAGAGMGFVHGSCVLFNAVLACWSDSSIWEPFSTAGYGLGFAGGVAVLALSRLGRLAQYSSGR